MSYEQLEEKDKQIDFLNSLITVRDQEIAQLRQLAQEWKQLVHEQQEDGVQMSRAEIEVWYETWERLKKRSKETEA